jgi:hypothetical protein
MGAEKAERKSGRDIGRKFGEMTAQSRRNSGGNWGEFIHKMGAIYTEINPQNRGNVVAYSFQRKRNLSEKRVEQKPVERIGNETRFGQPKTAGRRKANAT